MNDQWFKRYKNTYSGKPHLSRNAKTVIFVIILVCAAIAALFLVINFTKPKEAQLEKVEFIKDIKAETKTETVEEPVFEELPDSQELTVTDSYIIPNYDFSGSLKPDDENEDVKVLQDRLKQLGWLDVEETTTKYGNATKAAVQQFQKNNGLDADGIAGSETLDLLFSSAAKSYSEVFGTADAELTGALGGDDSEEAN